MAIIDYLIGELQIESIGTYHPNNVKYGSRQINKGTVMQFTDKTITFTTSQGNKVVVHIFPDDVDSYEIAFDVNGDRKEQSREKDSEILSGVFGVVLKAVDKYKINKLKIKADSDDRDTKIKKNIPMGDYEDRYKDILSKVLQILTSLDLSDNPSEAMAKIYQKRGKVYDPNANLNLTIKELTHAMDGDYKIYPQHISGLHYFPKEYIDEFNSIITEYNKRKNSYSDDGVKVVRNRRYEIYKRVIPKHFKDWDITFEDKFDTIYLER